MRLEVEEDPVYGLLRLGFYSELKYMSASDFWIESKSNKITSVLFRHRYHLKRNQLCLRVKEYSSLRYYRDRFFKIQTTFPSPDPTYLKFLKPVLRKNANLSNISAANQEKSTDPRIQDRWQVGSGKQESCFLCSGSKSA